MDIDKSTECKQLVTHLTRLGFSISVEEVSRFKQLKRWAMVIVSKMYLAMITNNG